MESERCSRYSRTLNSKVNTHTHDTETCSFDMLEGLDLVSSFEHYKISDESGSDSSLNPLFRLLAEWVERLILFQGGFSTLRNLDAFQIDESTFALIPCGCHLVVGQLSVAILGF